MFPPWLSKYVADFYAGRHYSGMIELRIILYGSEQVRDLQGMTAQVIKSHRKGSGLLRQVNSQPFGLFT
jgi:hypothetical protein